MKKRRPWQEYYHVWYGMIHRCTKPQNKDYARYGGRGITVCERWLNSRADFRLDMGVRPSSKHSIDRIDVNGDYEPDNCRWATTKEQAGNKRGSRILSVYGVSLCAGEWEHVMEVPKGRIQRRSTAEFSDHDAIFNPARRSQGESHYRSKLTEATVREARSLSKQGWKSVPLAKRFGVTQSVMSAAIRGATWKGVK